MGMVQLLGTLMMGTEKVVIPEDHTFRGNLYSDPEQFKALASWRAIMWTPYGVRNYQESVPYDSLP